jgi:hypothetical protein
VYLQNQKTTSAAQLRALDCIYRGVMSENYSHYRHLKNEWDEAAKCRAALPAREKMEDSFRAVVKLRKSGQSVMAKEEAEKWVKELRDSFQESMQYQYEDYDKKNWLQKAFATNPRSTNYHSRSTRLQNHWTELVDLIYSHDSGLTWLEYMHWIDGGRLLSSTIDIDRAQH